MSVLSNMPAHLAEVPVEARVPPIRPLFNVGVHDIGYLTELSKKEREDDTQSRQRAYIACSTDEILATKHNLYDILVEFPQGQGTEGVAQQWPSLRMSTGEQIRATQRDLRRYRALKKELQRIEKSRRQSYHYEDDEAGGDDESETVPLTQTTKSTWQDEDDDAPLNGEAQAVEATSWTAMAYSGFLWWASAGEKEAWLEDEASQDAGLLADLPLPEPTHGTPRPGSASGSKNRAGSGKSASAEDEEHDETDMEAQAKAMVVIAFAHRLTRMTIESMADMFDATEGSDEDEGAAKTVSVGSEDLRRMGLDVWSERDKDFARELLRLYFQRKAEVRGQSVECCGIKIC